MSEFISAPTGEKIAVQVIKPARSNGKCVFLEHGLAGFKEEGMMQTAARAFTDAGFTAVLFDARYGLGESDGALEHANFTHFIEDLHTIILWAKTQEWFAVPFALCGHSLGAGACLHFAATHSTDVLGVVSLSAVISGQLLLDSYLHHKPDFVHQWQKDRLLYRARADDETKNGFISYAHIEDALRYNIQDQAPRIKCPVLLVCGDKDISSTIPINTLLYDKLGGQKTLEIICNCNHIYQSEENKTALYDCIFNILKNF